MPTIQCIATATNRSSYRISIEGSDPITVMVTADEQYVSTWVFSQLPVAGPMQIAVAARRYHTHNDIAVIHVSFSNFSCLIYQIGNGDSFPESFLPFFRNPHPDHTIVGVGIDRIVRGLSSMFDMALDPNVVEIRTLALPFYGEAVNAWHINQFSSRILNIRYRCRRTGRWMWRWYAGTLAHALVLAAGLDVHVTLRIHGILMAMANPDPSSSSISG